MTDGASWGVKVLRQYLEFAKNGTIPEMPGAGGEPDSDFEISVGYILKSAGYDIVPQVGVAGFSIDIGVRDPATPGRFLAGIECDGAAYHSAKSARDRDRLRQEISLRAMAGKSIEFGQQTGLRINVMRRLDSYSSYLQCNWSRVECESVFLSGGRMRHSSRFLRSGLPPDLEKLNENIVGVIEVVSEFRREE